MTRFAWSVRSLSRLEGVHPDLVAVMDRALELSPLDLTIVEGLRTLDRQRELVARGSSKTMQSRHLTGHAVDVVPFVGGQAYPGSWGLIHVARVAIEAAALELRIPVEWGGYWRSFPDGAHWQLVREVYP